MDLLLALAVIFLPVMILVATILLTEGVRQH